MSKRKIFLVCAVAFLGVAFLYHHIRQIVENTAAFGTTDGAGYLLIDAGHGGQDGGTTTADGVSEDDINLSIALNLRDMLSFCGYSTVMTRTQDVSIQHADDTAESFKVRDMYNRLEMYNAATLTVSIHQNHFSQSQYHGAQLFFSQNTPESRDAAASIREQIVRLLQPHNTRELKPAGKNIFLLHRAQKPALIVECGFLSNPAEAERLKTASYRQQMAFAICCGILQYAPL